MPRRLSATRATPGRLSAGSPSDCSSRTRTGRIDGVITSSSLRCTVPAGSVPVTTVPLPVMLNERSIQIRTGAPGSGSGRPAELIQSADQLARPAPVTELTATAGISPRPG